MAALLALGASGAPALELQAHRGGRGLWPENTLAAFDGALRLGVDTLELDVALTADGVVVVSHDTALNAAHTRDAEGAWLAGDGPSIRSMTLAQLQRHDVGRIRPGTAYARQFPDQAARDGERVPTLAAVFALVAARGADRVRFNIETKIDPTRPEATAPPEAMVRALLAEIERAGMARRVTLQSFDWRTLALAGALMPMLPRAYLTSTRGNLRDRRWTAGLDAADFASTPALVQAAAGPGSGAGIDPGGDSNTGSGSNGKRSTGAGAVTWSPAAGDVTAADVREAHALGLGVVPWTVNDPEQMARLIDLGVDGLITDRPDVLRDVMRERGLPLPIAPAGR
jgi:glycerophosphoryl diester phosphodiesterase